MNNLFSEVDNSFKKIMKESGAGESICIMARKE